MDSICCGYTVTQVTAYLTKRFIRIFSLLHKKINVYLNYKNSVTGVTVMDKLIILKIKYSL